jgi:hypothetical protein
MQDLIIIHRRLNLSPLKINVPTWVTCLRQIAFLKESELNNLPVQLEKDDEILKGHSALCFLIQVVCGLQSTLLKLMN